MNSETHQHISVLAEEKMEHLIDSSPFLRRQERRELAAETVRAEIAQMEAAGKVLQLTDEEIRLLRSFRRFKTTLKKAGKVFRWQTVPLTEDVLVVDACDLVHIVDPQDVSQT